MSVVIKGVTVVRGVTIVSGNILRQVQIPGYQYINQTSLTTSAQVPGGPYVSKGK